MSSRPAANKKSFTVYTVADAAAELVLGLPRGIRPVRLPVRSAWNCSSFEHTTSSVCRCRLFPAKTVGLRRRSGKVDSVRSIPTHEGCVAATHPGTHQIASVCIEFGIAVSPSRDANMLERLVR